MPDGVVAVVRKLLPDNDLGAALAKQLPYARVASGCRCGCATVDLVVDRSAVGPAPQEPGNPVVGEGSIRGVDGQTVGGVILFAGGGYLSCLEVYSFGDEPIAELPDPAVVDP
ncbi:hypothetical protein [Actinokineospora sp. NBRC 105648]|uniref:hypothetical protein n=1 Tax=Actinokineospora sp. NBRC 105648 TaxID=3032206 RepID=UPI0025560B7C|nr:hypothetical protein [Actinokineospora sp. NBRC 105648]